MRRRETHWPSKGRLLLATPIPALILAAMIAMATGGIAAVKATEKPSFCSTCHEMQPYYAAWSQGPHKGVQCVVCHVDPGVTAEMTHKVSALKEVADHFVADPKFPRNDAVVPGYRCTNCHTKLPAVTKSGFKHAQHLSAGDCVTCHAEVGHKVSPDTLKKANLLAAGVLVSAATTASVDSTSASHVNVTCTRCHDIAKTACEVCHIAPHSQRGTCTTCHVAGVKWSFGHPGNAAQCSTCHEAPKDHFQGACVTCHDTKTPFAKTKIKHTAQARCTDCHTQPPAHVATQAWCTTCHTQAGVSWGFTHPAMNAQCTSCHASPDGHFGPNCSLCHSPSTPFAQTKYTHDSDSCASCHRAPSGHFGSDCSDCHTPSVRFQDTKYDHNGATSCEDCHRRPSSHTGNRSDASCYTCHRRPGTAWTFAHPGSSSCASCHSKPSGHVSASSTCYTCHRNPGSNWGFSHPGSSSCASCHRPPSNHYGSNCSGCHKPSVAFSRAVFRHPSITAPHGIAGKACSACHPSGPPAVSCTCHGGGSGPKGD